MGLSLINDVFLLEHATHPALRALHNIDIIGDLEFSLSVSHKHVVLVGGLVPVEEYLNSLGTTLIVTAEEALEVGPGRGIHKVSKVDVVVEGVNLVSGDGERAHYDALQSVDVGSSDTDVVLNRHYVVVALETEFCVALYDLGLG